MAGGFSIMANVLSGLIIFHSPTYEPKAWHSTLFVIGFVIIPVVLNLALRKVINCVETIAGILHFLFFVGFIIMLAKLAKRSTVGFVFNTLLIHSGWDNSGIAFSIGMLTTAFAVGSFDGVLHMSKLYPNQYIISDTTEYTVDETKEPRKLVPKAMFYSTISNSIMQTAFAITLMFCIGDEEAVSNSTLPIIEVFYSA
jgi:amino acid transporter